MRQDPATNKPQTITTIPIPVEESVFHFTETSVARLGCQVLQNINQGFCASVHINGRKMNKYNPLVFPMKHLC